MSQINDHLEMLEKVGKDSYDIITDVLEDNLSLNGYLTYGKKMKLMLALIIHQPFIEEIKKVFEAE